MTQILINTLITYAVGAVVFAGYNVLEIDTLQRQNELTRDKNLKNTITSQAKSHFDDIRGAWKWPVILVKSAITAIKWVKSL